MSGIPAFAEFLRRIGAGDARVAAALGRTANGPEAADA
jgi:hypothetical protein